MNAQKIYILIAIGALVVIAGLMFFIKKKKPRSRLSPFTSLSFAFIIAGIVFGENRLVGYGLMGIGVLLAFVDMIKKFRKRP